MGVNLFDIELKAGERSPHTIGGRYFRLLKGTGDVNLTTEAGEATRVIRGVGMRLEAFDWFALISDVDQTVTVLVSDYESYDNRTEGSVTIAADGAINVTGAVTIAASAASLTTVPANTDRRAISIRTDPDNSGPVFLVDAGNRFPLYPGDTFREEITGAVDLETAEGTDQTAYVYEVV